MRPLQADWLVIHGGMVPARPLLLCLDYDGTLVPLVDHPSQARLPADTRDVLEQLAGQAGVIVALISGRALWDLRRLVDIKGLSYVGNHGLEAEGHGVQYRNPVAEANRPRLKQLAGALTDALRPVEGAWVEDKGLTLSVHWRAVPRSSHRRFHRLIEQALAPYLARGVFRVTQDQRVVEIRPPIEWGKGDAIAWLFERASDREHAAPAQLIYLGDDRTDEDVFEAVNRLGGHSVFIGRPTRRMAATYWLRDPDAVRSWLAGLRDARGRAGTKRSMTHHALAASDP